MCDVLVEVSEGDAGVTVVPTIETLVVVGSGVTVVGTIVVVEDVAAAWGVVDVAAAWGVEDVAATWSVEDIELVLVLVLDALTAPAVD